MHCSVIFIRTVRTFNRHNHSKRVNSLVTIRHMESHNKVGIVAGEIINRESHSRRSYIGTACRCRSIKINILFKIDICISFKWINIAMSFN